ncbi:MAG: hypothetical protein KY395_07215, partial [Actinobacteria bacterium]|nr:hypothetical protein [Actinomycetota bacterium]
IPAGLRAAEAASLVREQGGLVYVPHPGDVIRHSLSVDSVGALARSGLVDVIEVLNAKCGGPYEGPTHGAAKAAASDSHVPQSIGSAWTEIQECDLADPQSLLSSLHDGTVHGAPCDPPRPWTARVVPSGLSIDSTG